MSQSTISGTYVEEESTPTYSAQIQDEDGNNLALTGIDTATVRCINVHDCAVIVADTNIKSSISSGGLLTWVMPATFLDFQDTGAAPRKVEEHQCIFKITQTPSGNVDVHHLFLKVRRSVETS